MKTPLVSVITPTFNMGIYLEECIKSVLNQEYPFIEHIIQDGKSRDKTLEILKKYSKPKCKEKIKWVSEPDKGQVNALNKAFKRAKGDILLILNADDALLPGACSWAVKNMAKFPKAAVVYGDQYLVDKKGKIVGTGVTGEFDYVKFLCIEQYMASQAAFIRRSLFEKVGFWVDESVNTMPDYELWLRIGQRFQMKYVPGIVTKYRMWPHSDGKQPRKGGAFFNAKKVIMDRIFNSPNTPETIKKIRRRAYAGLSLWVAEEMINQKNYKDYLLYSLRALLTYPSREVRDRLMLLFKEKAISKRLVYGE